MINLSSLFSYIESSENQDIHDEHIDSDIMDYIIKEAENLHENLTIEDIYDIYCEKSSYCQKSSPNSPSDDSIMDQILEDIVNKLRKKDCCVNNCLKNEFLTSSDAIKFITKVFYKIENGANDDKLLGDKFRFGVACIWKILNCDFNENEIIDKNLITFFGDKICNSAFLYIFQLSQKSFQKHIKNFKFFKDNNLNIPFYVFDELKNFFEDFLTRNSDINMINKQENILGKVIKILPTTKARILEEFNNTLEKQNILYKLSSENFNFVFKNYHKYLSSYNHHLMIESQKPLICKICQKYYSYTREDFEMAHITHLKDVKFSKHAYDFLLDFYKVEFNSSLYIVDNSSEIYCPNFLITLRNYNDNINGLPIKMTTVVKISVDSITAFQYLAFPYAADTSHDTLISCIDSAINMSGDSPNKIILLDSSHISNDTLQYCQYRVDSQKENNLYLFSLISGHTHSLVDLSQALVKRKLLHEYALSCDQFSKAISSSSVHIKTIPIWISKGFVKAWIPFLSSKYKILQTINSQTPKLSWHSANENPRFLYSIEQKDWLTLNFNVHKAVDQEKEVLISEKDMFYSRDCYEQIYSTFKDIIYESDREIFYQQCFPFDDHLYNKSDKKRKQK